MHDYNVWEKFHQKATVQCRATYEKPWTQLYYDNDCYPYDFFNFFSSFDNILSLNQYKLPFLFRGQADSSWTLKPQLYRRVAKCRLEEALRLEYDSIRYFKQHSRVFLPPNVIPENNGYEIGEWLALMQHYSTPTRMLDWTTSFNVALYFAVTGEPFNCDGAVWFFEPRPMFSAMKDLPEPTKDELKKIMDDEDEFVKYGSIAPFKIDTLERDIKTERIIPQKSVLTYCYNLFSDHAHIIGQALIKPDKEKETQLPLMKVVISPKAKRAIKQHLYKQNISAATLFPGIDGIGKTINEIIQLHCEVFFNSIKVQDK